MTKLNTRSCLKCPYARFEGTVTICTASNCVLEQVEQSESAIQRAERNACGLYDK